MAPPQIVFLLENTTLTVKDERTVTDKFFEILPTSNITKYLSLQFNILNYKKWLSKTKLFFPEFVLFYVANKHLKFIFPVCQKQPGFSLWFKCTDTHLHSLIIAIFSNLLSWLSCLWLMAWFFFIIIIFFYILEAKKNLPDLKNFQALQ